jgi:NAD(P)-dependent dehydrogenase (short-subunit alcohol dehydrogenase family)
MQQDYSRALIVGAGKGLSAAVARVFSREGIQIALAARNIEKLGPLCEETGARAFACDVMVPEQVVRLFDLVDGSMGPADVVIYNASARVRGPFLSLVPAEVEKAIRVSAFGGFLVAQQAVRRMLKTGHGAVFFTGASASVKGYAESAPFAMGKFALRGLAQSMARELSPHGIHVAHFVIDGGIKSADRSDAPGASDSQLWPEAIAENYLHVLRQHRSAWTWEMELRPWVEKF